MHKQFRYFCFLINIILERLVHIVALTWTYLIWINHNLFINSCVDEDFICLLVWIAVLWAFLSVCSGIQHAKPSSKHSARRIARFGVHEVQFYETRSNCVSRRFYKLPVPAMTTLLTSMKAGPKKKSHYLKTRLILFPLFPFLPLQFLSSCANNI